MTLGRIASLVGVALLVMAANILCTVLYMVIYGHLINPGHPDQFYQDHVKIAAPWCSIVAGMPLMFLAGWWVAGWQQSRPVVRTALVLWAGYAVIDFSILAAAGMTATIAGFFLASFLTKLGAACLGATWRERRELTHGTLA